jgi:hypothetical protein
MKHNLKYPFFYRLLRPLVIVFLWLKFGYRFKVAKNLPENYIVLSNHVTDFDPLFVGASFPRQMFFVASEHIARWPNAYKFLKFAFAPIMRYKGTVAAATVMDILRKTRDGQNVCLAIALKTKDDRIFVEAIDCRNQREGNEWIINFLLKTKPQKVLVDGASGLETFQRECKEQKLKNIHAATVKEVVQASSSFETAIAQKTLCHFGQPALRQSVTNCQHRAIGSGGGYGYKTLDDDIEVALIEATVLATHACAEAKEVKKQRISY